MSDDNAGEKVAERLARAAWLQVAGRFAMLLSVPLMSFVATIMVDARTSTIRLEERMVSLTDRVDRQINASSDRFDRQVTALGAVLNSRIDAQAERLQLLGVELNRLRDYCTARNPTGRTQ